VGVTQRQKQRVTRPGQNSIAMSLTPDPASTHRGVVIALMAIAMFGTIDVLNKLLTQHLPILQILWIRFLAFVPIALMLAWRPGVGFLWRSRRPFLQLLRSVIFVVEMGMFIAAVKLIPLADMQAVASAAPLVVVALSVPILKEPVGWRRWSAVGVGFVGMLIILRPGFHDINAGIWLTLAATILWGFYQILLRIVGRDDAAATSALWMAVVGAAGLSLVAPFEWVTPDATGWALLAALGLVGSLAHFAWSRAMVLAPAAALQPFTYLLIVYATVTGWLIFGDLPDRWTIAGAALIVCSGLYAFHRERVRARERGQRT